MAQSGILRFPQGRPVRRQREFCDAVARLKMALAAEKALAVTVRQALVAELGVFDNWTEDAAADKRAAKSPGEIARQILLVDYRLSVLRPLASKLDASLRHAVRQYAEASQLLLDANARRGPDGDWLDRPQRSEMEALMRALHPAPEDGKP